MPEVGDRVAALTMEGRPVGKVTKIFARGRDINDPVNDGRMVALVDFPDGAWAFRWLDECEETAE